MRARMEFTNVISSNIVEIVYVTHDDCDKTVYRSHLDIIGSLYVTYNNFRTYRYIDVSLKDVSACLNSESIGRALNLIVKRNYQSEEIVKSNAQY